MFRELSSEAVDWALGECGGIVAVWGPVAGLDASGEDRNCGCVGPVAGLDASGEDRNCGCVGPVAGLDASGEDRNCGCVGPVAGLDASGEDRNFLQLWESNHDSPVTTPPPASSSAFVFLDNTKCPSVYRTVS